MAITLHNLERVNAAIQQEHALWLEHHAPQILSLAKLRPEQFSVLDYPDLWSGARFFETAINPLHKHIEGDEGESAYQALQKIIDETKKQHTEDPKLTKEIADFEKKYRKYFNFLKQRCLLHAINQTLNDIESSDNLAIQEIKEKFQRILNTQSLVRMQKRSDCLQAHRDISILCYALRDKVSANEMEQIEQLEVLSKRLLDSHYVATKKMPLTEALTSDLSTATSVIGLATGLTAAILAIGSLIFPPLLVPAGILGMISFISYVSTTISAAKMTYEAIQYGRGPSPRDFKWLILDIVFAPFNLFGQQIFSALGHAWHASHPIKLIFTKISTLWDNVISNVLPDAINTKEVITDMLDVGSVFSRNGELKNTTSATSFQKIIGALAEHDHKAFNKISQTKENMAKSPSQTALHGRDFAFIKYPKAHEDSLPVQESYHGHILLWDAGYMGTSTSKEAQRVINAVQAYEGLAPDIGIEERTTALEEIIQHSEHYLNVYKDDETKGRYGYVDKLYQNAKKEWDNLHQFSEEDRETPVVLVGFKAH